MEWDKQPPNFKNLVRRAKDGDQKAFSEIYENCYTPVFRYLYLRLKNRTEVEDLAQTVFLKAFQSFPSFKEQGRPILESEIYGRIVPQRDCQSDGQKRGSGAPASMPSAKNTPSPP